MKIHGVHFVLTNQVFLGVESVLECGWCIYFLHWKKNLIFPLLAVADGFFVSDGTPGSLWPLSAGIPSGPERNASTCLWDISQARQLSLVKVKDLCTQTHLILRCLSPEHHWWKWWEWLSRFLCPALDSVPWASQTGCQLRTLEQHSLKTPGSIESQTWL